VITRADLEETAMAKQKSQLRFGQGPDSPAPGRLQPELTVAARRLAAAALEELGKLGVTVTLSESGRAHLSGGRFAPPAAGLTIERKGNLIEAYLIERAIAALKREQESGG
jgi:hypothetical protein